MIDPGEPRYMHEQLPAVMAADENLTAFLRGLDEMASELYDRVAAKEHLFDPSVAPLPMVRKLAAQVGVPIERDLPPAVQRRVARAAASNFAARGTNASLKATIAALTGSWVEIVDPGGIEVSPAPIAVGEEDRVEPPRGAARAAEPPASPDHLVTGDDDEYAVRIRIGSFGDATEESVRAAIDRELNFNMKVTELSVGGSPTTSGEPEEDTT